MVKACVGSILLAASLFAQRTVPIKTPKGDLELVIAGARVDSIGGVTIGSILDGAIRNNTPVEIDFLRFELIYLDQNGNPLDVCNVLGNPDRICSFTVFDNLPPGGSIALRSPGNRFNPGKPVPKGSVISSFAGRLVEARYSPAYSVEVKTPVREISAFDIAFTVNVREGIGFELKNKLESPIEILWDQSSYINERDESSRLVHAGVKYIDKERPQPNTVVPPLAKVVDTAFPANNIEFSSQRWSKQSLLPVNLDLTRNDSALDALIGKSVRLYLRFLIEDRKVDYLASFKIVAVSH